MNATNRNLVVRIVSSLFLLPAVLALLAFGGWPCAAFLAVVAGACTWEYVTITTSGFGTAQAAGVLGAALLPVAGIVVPERFAAIGFWIIAVVFFVAWIDHLVRGPLAEAPTRSAHVVTGALYGGLGIGSIAALRGGPAGLQWVVAALVITWGNDTVAYFAGRLFGRRKLYPTVSPNKTWEGFFGGMVGSVGGLFIARAVALPGLAVSDCVVLGLAGGILGPLGDLCESMLKRAYGAKDSGRVIPGHGGVLDRIDGLLFNAPMIYLYVTAARGHG